MLSPPNVLLNIFKMFVVINNTDRNDLRSASLPAFLFIYLD